MHNLVTFQPCNLSTSTILIIKLLMGKTHHKKLRDLLGYDDRWITILGLPIASMLISVLLFNDYYERLDWAYLMVCIPISFVYTAAYWAALRFAYRKVRNHYPAFEQFPQRIFWLFLGFIVLFFAVDVLLGYAFKVLVPSHKGDPSFLAKFIGSLLLAALVIMIYEVLSFSLQLQKTSAEKEQLERQNVESQLEGLRNQVNPHFLFNSLNTLIYLIPEDPEKAVRFVQQLSKVYRYVLESREAKTIPLQEELDFLKAYVFLQKERFGDSLQVRMEGLENCRQQRIVPLSLQLLFENATKHNVIAADKPLRIELFAENGHLVVRNKLQQKNQTMESTGVGLQNIKDRYRLVSDRTVEVKMTPEDFAVYLPLL